MSWSIFKEELQLSMSNPKWNDVSDFADFFTKKYDECMKRGIDNITQNTVIKGNTDLMRSTIIIALTTGNQSKTELFYSKSFGLLGKGAVAYWTGAELSKNPPIVPAPGTVLNLSVVSNTVTNPGVWPATPLPLLPSNSTDPFIDGFILLGTLHLQTISGICNTISQYPPPASPGPAVLLWTGFTVDPAKAESSSLSASNPNNISAEKQARYEELLKRRAAIDEELYTNPNPDIDKELQEIQSEIAAFEQKLADSIASKKAIEIYEKLYPNQVYTGTNFDASATNSKKQKISASVGSGKDRALYDEYGNGEWPAKGNYPNFIISSKTRNQIWYEVNQQYVDKNCVKVKIPTSTGPLNVILHKDFASIVNRSISEIKQKGLEKYIINPQGGLVVRSVTNGTRLSNHAWGLAMDIADYASYPFGSRYTNSGIYIGNRKIRDLNANDIGFKKVVDIFVKNGCTWLSNNDPMHISIGE